MAAYHAARGVMASISKKGGTPMDQGAWAREFRARYQRREDELKWLYKELYHGDEGAYEYFVGMLCRA